MNRLFLFCCMNLFLFSCNMEGKELTINPPLFNYSEPEFYVSLPKQKSFFQKIDKPGLDVSGAKIQAYPDQTYQSIDGFGFTLTGGSAQLIYRLDAAKRASLLQELFGKNGISVLRIGVGATD